MTAAIVASLVLLVVYRHETGRNRPVDVVDAVWHSVRGLAVAALLLLRGAR